MQRLLPSYPLFVKDPIFSFWSPTNEPTQSETTFWTNQKKSLTGIIKANGVSYSFLGSLAGAMPLKCSNVEVNVFETVYKYATESFELEVRFVSPLPLNDLDILSNPSCYMGYTVVPKSKNIDIEVALLANENTVYNIKDDIKGAVVKFDSQEVGYFGRKRQLYLSNSSDMISADWGYLYLSGAKSYYSSESGIRQYLINGNEPALPVGNEDRYLAALNIHKNIQGNISDKIIIAYDEVMSIFYFGEILKGYYFRNGKTILDAITEAYNNYEQVLALLKTQEQAIIGDASRYGEDYKLIVAASYRQSIAAHKLVADSKGNILFLSKECDSNGCIATVDVTYPSAPLYLLYAPELVEGMLRPVFEFAKMPVWEYDFAPHDVGTYPFCLGQVYGLQKSHFNRYVGDSTDNNKHDGSNHPMFYQYPKGSDIYEYDMQMPVEECGNMLILSSALYLINNRKEQVIDNLDSLRKWADYLAAQDLEPQNQLCTDDFAGHLEKNINLSIKAAVALAAWAEVEKQLGNPTGSTQYRKSANLIQEHILNKFKGWNHLPLTFDNGPETFSLKYNMAFDKILNLGLFPQDIIEKEIDKYLEETREYGVPLDSRKTYTKSDWILWSAALTQDQSKTKRIIEPVVKFLKESTSRVPFSDWYETENGQHIHFQNRTVQGGNFMLILMDKFANKQ